MCIKENKCQLFTNIISTKIYKNEIHPIHSSILFHMPCAQSNNRSV